jgi:tellurite resistance-related uncharacterized protein
MNRPNIQPYKTTPVFDEKTLPAAMRNEHRTKPETWGLLRVLEGRVVLVFVDPHREVEVSPGRPAEIAPRATHFVRTDEAMRLQVEFYKLRPDILQEPCDG